MRLLTCLFVLVLLVGTAAAAAPVHTDKGDKAMVFMFHGLDHLGLRGYGDCWGVGMRYYISDMTAIRGGLIYGSDKYTQKSQIEGGDDAEQIESEYGFDVNYEKHLEAPCASVSPYIGAGVGYFNWKYEEPLAVTREYDKYKESESGFDVHALAGFEWGFTECMTLGGEYQLGFRSGTYKEEAEYVGGDTSTISESDHSWMGFGTASVFLSVYW